MEEVKPNIWPGDIPGQSALDLGTGEGVATALGTTQAAADLAGTLDTLEAGKPGISRDPGATGPGPGAADAAQPADSGLQMISRPQEPPQGLEYAPAGTLVAPTYEAVKRSLAKHAADANMAAVAGRLHSLGYLEAVDPAGVQSYPRKAIAEFQRDKSLPADGRYNEATHASLWGLEPTPSDDAA